MARKPRQIFEGAYYHVFNRGVEKRPIYFDAIDRITFLKLLGEAATELKWKVFCYCLMDNHYHLFLQNTVPNLDKGMQKFQGRYAQFINLRYERVGYLFQGRYQSRIVDIDSYALELCRYIHKNPLELALEKPLELYEWSSYPSYLGIIPRPKWLDTDWMLSLLSDNPEHSVKAFKSLYQ